MELLVFSVIVALSVALGLAMTKMALSLVFSIARSSPSSPGRPAASKTAREF
jgi:hypothetical protein